jgi:hypothetical protein
MLSVVKLNVIMLSIIMMTVNLVSVIVLGVVILNVVAPLGDLYTDEIVLMRLPRSRGKYKSLP